MIITIIVIIILSAVVVMTVSRNNPLNSAREAVFKEDISNFKTELELYKANMKYRDENPEELNVNRETTPHIQEVITSMPNKYAKILEVRDGKLVYIGNNKAEYLLANNMGMLPEDELLDDEIMEELQPFITEWTVSDNDSITLPITGGECNFTVDYGDGTGEYKVTSKNDEDIIHTYEKAGRYTVTIKGKCTSFVMEYCDDKEKLTRLVQWGSTGFTSVNFRGCKNLVGIIPEPSENSLKNLTSLKNLFADCISLTGQIPENLFSNCTEVTSMKQTFGGCEGLTGEIPEKLFINCTRVKDFCATFIYCTKLSGSIPDKLFINSKEVNDFASVFQGCKSITGEIPENLFDSCSYVTSFARAFYACTNITGKAPALWERENVTGYDACFRGCNKLSNFAEIPETWK